MSEQGWLILNLNKIRVEDKDRFCKSFLAKMKWPLAYVDKQGNVLFNKIARDLFQGREDETKEALQESWRFHGKAPMVVCLTNSLLMA